MYHHPPIKMNINMIMLCSRVNKHSSKLTQLIQLDSSLHQRTSNMMFHYKWNLHWSQSKSRIMKIFSDNLLMVNLSTLLGIMYKLTQKNTQQLLR